jgi:nitrogen regulatory protein P-II 1
VVFDHGKGRQYNCRPNECTTAAPTQLDDPMKQVVAVVKPYLAEKVFDALTLAPIEACGVCEVKGYGRQKNYLDEYRGSEYSMAYLPKVEITLWVEDDRLEEVVRALIEVARTGRMGDGKIFVLPAMEGELLPQRHEDTKDASKGDSPIFVDTKIGTVP